MTTNDKMRVTHWLAVVMLATTFLVMFTTHWEDLVTDEVPLMVETKQPVEGEEKVNVSVYSVNVGDENWLTWSKQKVKRNADGSVTVTTKPDDEIN